MEIIYDKNMKRGKILKRTMKLSCVISVIAVLGYFGFLHMKIGHEGIAGKDTKSVTIEIIYP
ncbi:hypothetical protein AM232_05165 [Bacillus sp. FJAT-21352]|nr:hypothetical protein AM232_05165 [Bacillus sp. FJAT-21352]